MGNVEDSHSSSLSRFFFSIKASPFQGDEHFGMETVGSSLQDAARHYIYNDRYISMSQSDASNPHILR